MGEFRLNQTYPGIIQAYSGIFRTMCYPDLIKTVVYPEPLHVQKLQHIQNAGIFRTLLYSECWQISNLSHIQNPVTHYNEVLIIFTTTIFFHKLQLFSQNVPR